MSNAKTYKENGYTHLLLTIHNFANTPIIEKGFKSKRGANKHVNEMSLNERNACLFDVVTVNQAIKKGY